MKDILVEYVADLSTKGRSMKQAIVNKDQDLLASLSAALRSSGSTYGFDPITEAAEKVEKALADGAALEAVREDVNALAKLCTLARPPAEAG